MTVVLARLTIARALGAFDTLYYHEWRARPVASDAKVELVLHAARDFIYALIFATLPRLAFCGASGGLLGFLLLAEVGITLSDFVVEDRVRKPIGGVFAGERMMHAVMGIVYGAMLANLVPILVEWGHLPTQLRIETSCAPYLRWVLSAMAVGVFVSGVRDLYAVFELPRSGWPWKNDGEPK